MPEINCNEVIKIIKEIRSQDCGGWLKDCTTFHFTCRDGHEKRLDLMRLLDKLYKAAGC